ncbi:MAG: hypothetical protein R3352_05090 [Salinisphaeraceae bacterium]|nr:hypothetical protein [Salinisphaeraceae bacterium]
MMKLLTALMTTACLALAGCATKTPYKPADERGKEGYTETRLGENRYRVTFVGNSTTPAETVKDYALLRAAELTLQEGYKWFSVAERDKDKKTRSATTVGTGFSSPGFTTVYQRCGVLSCQTAVSSSPGFSTGFGVSSTVSSSSFSYSFEIFMGKTPMPKDPNAYDARELAKSLRGMMQRESSDS